MKSLVIVCAILLLAVANVRSSPTHQCYAVGEYIPDDTRCDEFWQCDAANDPVAYYCDGGNCWDQKNTRCATNLLVCTTPCAAPTAAPKK